MILSLPNLDDAYRFLNLPNIDYQTQVMAYAWKNMHGPDRAVKGKLNNPPMTKMLDSALIPLPRPLNLVYGRLQRNENLYAAAFYISPITGLEKECFENFDQEMLRDHENTWKSFGKSLQGCVIDKRKIALMSTSSASLNICPERTFIGTFMGSYGTLPRKFSSRKHFVNEMQTFLRFTNRVIKTVFKPGLDIGKEVDAENSLKYDGLEIPILYGLE